MPRPPRFFISPDQILEPYIAITGEDSRHIAVVLRMRPGEQVLLCDGRGAEYAATIVSIDRAEIKAEIVSRSTQDLPSPRITLGQGIPKSDKMDLIVQKATELGVSSIVPLVTERTIVKLRDEEKRLVRWRKICREAAMQSNRPDIPLVDEIRQFPDFVLGLNSASETLLLLPWEEGTEPIRNVLRKHGQVKNVFVLIGPEGGFSAKEAALAREEGFYAVSLGRNILRTETAAIAVLSMIQYEFC
jgi:16S rRNA (uracil1498-N3)-methyltransferase